VELRSPAALLIGPSDGRRLVPPECRIELCAPDEKLPVVLWGWIAPGHRGKGHDAEMIGAGCRLILGGTEPARVAYALPFTPGGWAAVHRAAGRRFIGASSRYAVILSRSTGSLPPPDRTEEVDDVPPMVSRARYGRLRILPECRPGPVGRGVIAPPTAP
jgi:hypothetical protein